VFVNKVIPLIYFREIIFVYLTIDKTQNTLCGGREEFGEKISWHIALDRFKTP
jgi:hypothetical protein